MAAGGKQVEARYRIGQFAKLAGVTAKTLRFYDEIGLFRPSVIDPLTRYRFYQLEQLQELASVLALKDLGLSLTNIRRAIGGVAASERRYALLSELKTATERSLRRAAGSLELINAALEDLRGIRPTVPVVLKHQAAVSVASVRTTVASYVEIETIGRDLRAALPSTAVGDRCGALWHRCEPSPVLEGEAFISVTGRVPARQLYDLKQLPAATLACAYCLPDDVSAASAYHAVDNWITMRGYRLAGPKREIYLDRMLEIQFPVLPG
jgi:DNA-binding transcriptional MerR regulator